MSVVPEVILHRVLIEGIRAIRKDNRILDTLFRNLDQTTLSAIKKFINENSIHLSLNYPRDTELHVPALVLLLKSEQEAQTFLGDIAGASPHYDMPDQSLSIDTLGGGTGASTSNLSGLPRKLLGPLRVASAVYHAERDQTAVTLDTSHSSAVVDLLRSPVPSTDLYVVGGNGAGQVGTILNFRNLTLDIDGRFDPQLDTSSLVDIRLADDTEVVGEPSRVYPSSATNLLRKGANYDTQYQLSVIAGHQDQVLYLYTIVKALLFSQKAFMEEQGLMAFKITGTDYAPRTDFLPNEIFQRVMILNFTYPFTFLQEIETFDTIRIRLDGYANNNLCSTQMFDVTLGDDE